MRRYLAAACALTFIGGAAQAKDTLTLGMPLEPNMLDPTAGAAAAIREVTYDNIFQGLTRIDEKGEVQPGLAQSWTVSPDGLTYTFKLHTGVKFHDGTPFDCGIVQYSFKRAAAPDSTNAQKGFFEPIVSTECPDPATAVITLKRPTGAFLFDMGMGDSSMIAPNSAANDKTNPVGTGPFVFKRWVKGDRVEIERNPNYWGTPREVVGGDLPFHLRSVRRHRRGHGRRHRCLSALPRARGARRHPQGSALHRRRRHHRGQDHHVAQR